MQQKQNQQQMSLFHFGFWFKIGKCFLSRFRLGLSNLKFILIPFLNPRPNSNPEMAHALFRGPLPNLLTVPHAHSTDFWRVLSSRLSHVNELFNEPQIPSSGIETPIVSTVASSSADAFRGSRLTDGVSSFRTQLMRVIRPASAVPLQFFYRYS